MIEIFPFFPLFFRKPEQEVGETIDINLQNQSNIDIIYTLNDGTTLGLSPDSETSLDGIKLPSTLIILSNQGKLINVEISGENTNETYPNISDQNPAIIDIDEDVTIIITDYVEEVGETIKINIDNQSNIIIDYMLNEEAVAQISNNSQVILETLNPDSALQLSIPEGELINIEISGENTNETYTETQDKLDINVTENLTIIITDFVEEGGGE